MLMSELRNELDKIVYGQHHAKNQLLSAILSDIELYKDKKKHCQTNILLYGPTGSGKTFLVENLCRIIKIPLFIIDASKLTQTGYAGDKIENTLETIVRNNSGNVNISQRAVLFIDEFDKLHLSESSYFHSDIAGLGVQYELLKLMEGSDYILDYNNQRLSFSTKDLIVICAGAFSHTDLLSTDECGHWLKGAGFIDELIGRFTRFIKLESFSAEDYYQLLELNLSTVYQQYKYLLEKHGVTINIRQEDYCEIVEKAANSSYGIRTINLLLEKLLSDMYYYHIIFEGEKEI